jgi:hypothetical protein
MAKGGGIRRNPDLEQLYVEETTRSGSPPSDQQAETVAGVQHGLIWRDIEHNKRGEAITARSPWRRGGADRQTQGVGGVDEWRDRKKIDRNLPHGSCKSAKTLNLDSDTMLDK